MFAVRGDSCPWKRESWQLSEDSALAPALCKREVYIGPVCINRLNKVLHWLMIYSWAYRPWIALMYDCIPLLGSMVGSASGVWTFHFSTMNKNSFF